MSQEEKIEAEVVNWWKTGKRKENIKGKSMIYKILHRKLKIEKHTPHQKSDEDRWSGRVDISCSPSCNRRVTRVRSPWICIMLPHWNNSLWCHSTDYLDRNKQKLFVLENMKHITVSGIFWVYFYENKFD